MKKSSWHRYDVNDQTAEMPKNNNRALRHNEVLTALLNISQSDMIDPYSLLGIKNPSAAYATIKSPLQRAMDQVAI